jgi:hypothetical protein
MNGSQAVGLTIHTFDLGIRNLSIQDSLILGNTNISAGPHSLKK